MTGAYYYRGVSDIVQIHMLGLNNGIGTMDSNYVHAYIYW